jgi:hypothetical protein
MTRRRWLIIFLMLVLCVSAAYALRNAIYDLVVIPLAYLWWVIRLSYHLIPQVILWIVLVILTLFIAVRELLMSTSLKKQTKEVRTVPRSPVENLSMLLQKQKRGIYYRWLIANRLGKVARELLDQREGHRMAKRFTRLTGRDWNPSHEVEAYLESGLNGTFADYPQSRWSRSQPTPFDLPPQHVIEYLESEMEMHRNGNH